MIIPIIIITFANWYTITMLCSETNRKLYNEF